MKDLPHDEKLEELVDKATDDVQRFANQEQKDKDIEREVAISNVLFEFRAYYGRNVPDYITRLEQHFGTRRMGEILNEMKRNPAKHKGGRRDAAFTLTVKHGDVADMIEEELKEELKNRGEPL